MEGFIQCSANYTPLSPISFLDRASFVYGEKQSIVYGNTRHAWRETHERCIKLASGLSQLGINRRDVVAALAPNIPSLYELHFAVPMAGAVLSALNTGLDVAMLSSILNQLEPKVIFVDNQFVDLVLDSFEFLTTHEKMNPPRLILIYETDQTTPSVVKDLPLDILDYNELLEIGQIDFKILYPIDESDPISVSYTSGTTGNPKGVVYSHRAAYLNSLAAILSSEMRSMPVFLWTVDMFRCNGWCLTWAMAALGGTNICLRNVSAKAIFDSIYVHKVTHLCGKPTLLNKIADEEVGDKKPFPCKVEIKIAGPLPPLKVLTKVEEMGFNISLGYGMTEALGPVTTKMWNPNCNFSPIDERDKIKCREGIHNLLMEGIDVKNQVTMKSVPPDGKTVGEVMLRGNTLMSGYMKNVRETKKAFKGGWYRTGDIGVRYPDGCIRMKDRAGDIIISSRGETISTVEVEEVIVSHPMVLEAAVFGKPDVVFGETTCAVVKLKEGSERISVQEIIKFCEDHLPYYMVPRTVIFGDLPVNSTGKIQKFVLREEAKAKGHLSS